MECSKKRNDMLLIGAVLVLALLLYAGTSLFGGAVTKNAEAVVTVDGKEYGRYPLNVDAEERIVLEDGAYNILLIQDGKADVIEASCPDGICVHHRAVYKQGQSITCLPNKLIVEIQNGEEAEVDAITN